MIFKFQPFAIDKNIGNEYNSHCRIVPKSEDWILILDYDAQILTPETYKVIEAAIEKYPDTAIFGAKTNRIAYSYQRLLPQIDENDSIKHHTNIAIDLAERFKSGECESAKTIAGFFMLFRKSYWEKSPFQTEIFDRNNNLFDYSFTRVAMKEKLPIRIIKGAYLWHSYRILKENVRDTTHLRTWHKDGSYT